MSNLQEINKHFRECTIAKNDYNNNDPYNVGHKNAVSDGDELGKGEKNGNIGGVTDIKTRECLATKNKYNSNKQYDSGTVN